MAGNSHYRRIKKRPEEIVNSQSTSTTLYPSVSDLLLQIPTLQFLGAVPAPEEFDYDCGPSSLRVDRERWLSLRTEQLDAVRQLGADSLVTVSHACQREWCDVSDDTLTVRNYISLVAEAIGCVRSYESDALGHLKRYRDLDALVEGTRSTWTSHGLSKEKAKAVARKYSWATKNAALIGPIN